MPVANLRFNIMSHWNGDGVRAARRDINSAGSDIQRSTKRLGDASRGFFTLTNAALALGPALAPIGIVTLGVAGGLVAATAGAGLAGGAFAALAITAAKNADKMGSSGKQYSTALNGVKTAWMSLARETAPLTLKPMTTVLKALGTAIPKLKPLIQDLAPVFQNLANATAKWLTGAGFERFLGVLRTQGVPALRNFIAAGRSMAGVLGSAFRAMLPLGVQLSAALARGAAALARWAAGGGFERFMARVRQDAPAVKEFFRALGAALANLGRAIGQMSGPSLSLATALLRIVAAIPPGTLARMVQGFILLRSAILALRIATVAATAIRALAAALLFLAANPIVAFLILLGLEIMHLVQKWNELKAAGASPIDFVVRMLGEVGTALGIRNIMVAWRLLQGLVKIARFVVSLIGAGVMTIMRTLAATWRNVISVAGRVARFLATLVGAGIRTGMNALSTAWRVTISLAARVARFLARLVGQGITGGMRLLTSTWRAVISIAGKVARFLATLVGGGIVGAMRGIIGAWNAVLSAAKKVATFIIKKVTGGAGGGPIAPGYAIGGRIGGKGGPRSDKQPIMASPGEFMINARATRAWGPGFMHMVNGGPTKAQRSGLMGRRTVAPEQFHGVAHKGREGGGDIVYEFHFHDKVYARSEREFETMLVGALKEVKRKGRMP